MVLSMFATLQRITDLKAARHMYTDMFIVLNTPDAGEAVDDAYNRIVERLDNTESTEFDEEENKFEDIPELHGGDPIEKGDLEGGEDQEEVVPETTGTLRQSSPFTSYFEPLITEYSKSIDQQQQVSNDKYSPSSFDVVKKMIHLWPLWSAGLQNQSQSSDDVTLASNAAVESYFRALKVHRMGMKSRLSPREVITKQLTYVRGKLNALLLPAGVRKPVKEVKTTMMHETESKWSRRSSKSYHNRKNATSILKDVVNSTGTGGKRVKSDDVAKATKRSLCCFRTTKEKKDRRRQKTRSRQSQLTTSPNLRRNCCCFRMTERDSQNRSNLTTTLDTRSAL